MKDDLYTKDLKKRHSKICFQKSGQYCWETPQDFFDELNKEFNFNLDVCANEENHKCDIYFSEEQDGLKQDWEGVCFMNPPYGREISKWIKKAFNESQKKATVVCLIPSRTETRWWWDYCMKGEIRFIKGKLKFKGRNTKGELVNYPATFGCAIVIFKDVNKEIKPLCEKIERVNNNWKPMKDWLFVDDTENKTNRVKERLKERLFHFVNMAERKKVMEIIDKIFQEEIGEFK